VSGRALGSGFFVTDRLIATNAHVVGALRNVGIFLDSGRRVTAKVIYADRQVDFALVESPVLGVPLSIRTDTIADGETVMALGFPQGRDQVAFSSGTVRSVTDGWLVHDALVAGGSSGGPLVDARWRVVGVNTLLQKRRGDMTNVSDRVYALGMAAVLRSIARKTRISDVDADTGSGWGHGKVWSDANGTIQAPGDPARSGIMPGSQRVLREGVAAIRKCPFAKCEVIGQLRRSDEVLVDASFGGWYRIVERTPNGETRVVGWVEESWFKTLSSSG